jgi:hypothetical protein
MRVFHLVKAGKADRMTREELYALVWATPMIQLAKNYGISDVGLRKICVKHGIPTPHLGYWAKAAAGKKVKQPPLPPAPKYMPPEIRLTVVKPIDAPQELLAAQAIADQYEAANKVIVPPTRPEHLHAIAIKAEKILRKAKPNADGFVSCSTPDLPTLIIGPSSVDRAVLILDTLVKALLARGWKLELVEDSFCIVVQGERFTASFYETKQKIPHTPTKDDLKRQRDHDDLHNRYPTIYRNTQIYRSWDYKPSGRLAFRILDPTVYSWSNDRVVGRWMDHRSSKLETYLNAAMIALATGAARVKVRRAEEAEKARRQAEVEARHRRQIARCERATNRQKFLELKSETLVKLNRLEALSDFWREKLSESPNPLVARMHEDLLGLIKKLRQELSLEVLANDISRLGLVLTEDLQAD